MFHNSFHLQILKSATTLLLNELPQPEYLIDRKLVNHQRARIRRFYEGYRLTPEQEDVLLWCKGKEFKHRISKGLNVPKKYLNGESKMFH